MTGHKDYCGHDLIVSGKIFRIAQVNDEWDIDIDDPYAVVKEIKARKTRADVFSFSQKLPHTKPLYDFFFVMDNIPAIPISSYEDWWKNVNRRVRLKVNKAQRLGVEARIVEFNDDLVRQIKEIFDDSPIRQGVPSRHYKKPLKYIREKMGTLADRADFICAYHNEEPLGIIKLVYSGNIARMVTILGKISARELAPVNAMLAKAVERCIEKDTAYITYGKMFYGNKGFDSLAQFKVHNGFYKFDVPRYYIPLTRKGKVYIAFRLYKHLNEIIPEFVARPVREIRQRMNSLLRINK